jgi:hypothetical protein
MSEHLCMCKNRADNAADFFTRLSLCAQYLMPEASLALIEKHDELHRACGKAGWGNVPDELKAARAAVEADPFAKAGMDLRAAGNEAGFAAWLAKEKELEGKGGAS